MANSVKIKDKKITRVATNIGYSITLGEETANVTYSLNDEFGQSIQSGTFQTTKELAYTSTVEELFSDLKIEKVNEG